MWEKSFGAQRIRELVEVSTKLCVFVLDPKTFFCAKLPKGLVFCFMRGDFRNPGGDFRNRGDLREFTWFQRSRGDLERLSTMTCTLVVDTLVVRSVIRFNANSSTIQR